MRYDDEIPLYNINKEFVSNIDCNVAYMETEQSQKIFGNIKLNRIIICMNKPLPFKSGYVEVENISYKIINSQRMRQRYTHFAEEYSAGISK